MNKTAWTSRSLSSYVAVVGNTSKKLSAFVNNSF